MGAVFLTMTLAGDVDRSLVNAAFENRQAEDRFENGHAYSGGFGMARGLRFAEFEFPDAGAARDWLEANCWKWEEAKAVRIARLGSESGLSHAGDFRRSLDLPPMVANLISGLLGAFAFRLNDSDAPMWGGSSYSSIFR